MLEIRRVNAFEDNYIWVVGERGSSRVAVVDPGDPQPVIEALESARLQPEALLITHHHGDHTGGIDTLVQRYDIPVYGPARESIPQLTHPVAEGDAINLGPGMEFKVIDTPGHTRGHVCYVGAGVLFCGDTLFTGGCGKLFEGTAAQMHQSLEKLRALPDETLVYCAHEYTLANLAFARIAEPDNRELEERETAAKALRARGEATVPAPLGLEKRTNPFLRSEALKDAAEGFAGHPLPTASDVFAAVRHWKDTLD